MKKIHGLIIDQQNGVLEVCAGESIPNVSRKAAKYGLHGLEWAVGIPGTIGGAVVMNAGAQGGSTSEWLESAKVMTTNNGEIIELNNKELNFTPAINNGAKLNQPDQSRLQRT